MPSNAVRWGAPRSGDNRVGHSQKFHNWRFERNQVEEVRYVRGTAPTIPRATNEPLWDLKPAPDARQVAHTPRPCSAPSTPRRSSYSCGACESEGMHAIDLPVSRADQKTYTAQVERLRSGGVRVLYPKPERGKGQIALTVPSHKVSPRPGRPPHTRPASARGPRRPEVSRAQDARIDACLKLLMQQPSAFCTLILCGSKDAVARQSTLRTALKEAYPQAPVGVVKGDLRPGTMEVIFFSSCDFSITSMWVSSSRSLKRGIASLAEGPEPDELVRLVTEQCTALSLKLEESKKCLEAATAK